MRWTCFFMSLFLLTQLGCSSRGDGGGAKTEVRFLIAANGIIDQAILDGRLPAIVFADQQGSEVTITKVQGSNALDPTEVHGFKPGDYRGYTFPVTVGEHSFADAGILMEKPVPVKGAFKLTNIKSLGTVELSGTTKDGGEMNGAGHRVFSATLEPFKGTVENKAKAEEEEKKDEK